MIFGITGGIGGGKSTFSDLLRTKGFNVYNTDLEARRLQNENIEIKTQIIEVFGEKSYINNELNRPYVAQIVFNNKELLKKLNTIVHPYVSKDVNAWIKQHSSEKHLFIECAILFESNFSFHLDKIIVITAPEEIRIDRVIKRDNTSRENVLARINNQMNEEKKVQLADYVIITDDSKSLIEKTNDFLHSISI